MRAAQVTTLEGPQSVKVSDQVERPVPGDGEVLVEVYAAGVTFPDVLQTRGQYQVRPDLPFVPGAEFAGVVVEGGTKYAPGTRVAGIEGIGAFAEYAVVDESHVLPLPDSLSFVDAAGMPMNVLTMDFALNTRARLEPGETVLVHGAAGGVGVAAVQLAKAQGATVIAVVSTEAKEAIAKRAGADHVVRADGFLQAVKELTDDAGVDVVVDPVGGDRFTDSIRSLRRYGRVLVLGFTGGEIPTVKVNRLLLTNTSVIGVGWGEATRSGQEFHIDQWEKLRPLIESGKLNPVIDQVLPLEQAGTAIERLDQRAVLGKIILEIKPEA